MGIGENMQYKRFPLWEKGCLAAIIILILAALLPARSLEAKEDRPVVRIQAIFMTIYRKSPNIPDGIMSLSGLKGI